MQFTAKKSELSKHFISLKDGEEIVGVFLGEPHVHYNHWDNTAKRSMMCAGDDCKLCASGDKKKFRFRLNMAVKGANGPEAKIVEGGWKLYSALSELNNEFPLDQNYSRIKRSGKTMNDTVYTVLPVVKEKLSEATMAQLKNLNLLPLDPSDSFWGTSSESHEEEESVPF